jgi:AcrR family transcriptional regulator
VPTATAAAAQQSSSTHERLIDAAEQLFAERGIDAVSLREITRVSGARNAVAAQYHFTDRVGLVRAVMARHMPEVEMRRHSLLDAYEAVGDNDLRELTGCYVRALAPKLTSTSGRAFLVVHADVLNRPTPQVSTASLNDPCDSSYRWRTMTGALLTQQSLDLHRRFTAILHCSVELARRAKSAPRRDDRLFISELIDVTAAMLGASSSPETIRLLEQRQSTRGKLRSVAPAKSARTSSGA